MNCDISEKSIESYRALWKNIKGLVWQKKVRAKMTIMSTGGFACYEFLSKSRDYKMPVDFWKRLGPDDLDFVLIVPGTKNIGEVVKNLGSYFGWKSDDGMETQRFIQSQTIQCGIEVDAIVSTEEIYKGFLDFIASIKNAEEGDYILTQLNKHSHTPSFHGAMLYLVWYVAGQERRSLDDVTKYAFDYSVIDGMPDTDKVAARADEILRVIFNVGSDACDVNSDHGAYANCVLNKYPRLKTLLLSVAYSVFSAFHTSGAKDAMVYNTYLRFIKSEFENVSFLGSKVCGEDVRVSLRFNYRDSELEPPVLVLSIPRVSVGHVIVNGSLGTAVMWTKRYSFVLRKADFPSIEYAEIPGEFTWFEPGKITFTGDGGEWQDAIVVVDLKEGDELEIPPLWEYDSRISRRFPFDLSLDDLKYVAGSDLIKPYQKYGDVCISRYGFPTSVESPPTSRGGGSRMWYVAAAASVGVFVTVLSAFVGPIVTS